MWIGENGLRSPEVKTWFVHVFAIIKCQIDEKSRKILDLFKIKNINIVFGHVLIMCMLRQCLALLFHKGFGFLVLIFPFPPLPC